MKDIHLLKFWLVKSVRSGFTWRVRLRVIATTFNKLEPRIKKNFLSKCKEKLLYEPVCYLGDRAVDQVVKQGQHHDRDEPHY